MDFKTVEVGPKEARELLANNSVNRKMADNNVTYIAKQILAGNYRQTGDTIKLSKTGRLLDGQHRLAAIIKADRKVTLTICTGLEDDVFDVLDTGKNRSAGDVLSIRNIANPNEVAACAMFLYKYQGSGMFTKDKVSNTQVIDTINNSHEIVDIVAFICKLNTRFRMVSSSNMSALYYLFSKKNQTKAEEFINKYYSGLDLENDNPIYILRDKLIRDSTNKVKIKPIYKASLIVTAWNLFVQNKTAKRLDWELGVFPKIK